jgi:hypothetical protein
MDLDTLEGRRNLPNIEEHCKRSLKHYAVEGRDIHQWLDEPSRKYAGAHRQFRHDTETIRLVGELFGKKYGRSLAENIALDHIMLDHEEEIKKRRTVVVKFPEKKEIPSIPCSYCSTLLKPSDQFCPNCGASRTKIIEKFDREYELEKIKLQEARKKLRKELKRELHFREMTPEERLSIWTKYSKGDPRDPRYSKRYPLLTKLIQEDFEKYPEIKEKFEMKAKQWKEERHIRKTLVVLGLLWVIAPAILISQVYHWNFGVIWLVFWSVTFWFLVNLYIRMK